MYGGGGSINKQTELILRLSGFVVPVALLFYGLLVREHVVDAARYAGDTFFVILMSLYMVLSSYQVIYPIRGKADAAFRTISYHVLSGLYIIFVSGFTTPFIAAWVLLFLAANAFFSRIGYWLSIVSLVITLAADSIIHIADPGSLLLNAISTIAVLVTGVTAVSLSRVQEVDGAELSRSQAQERLQQERILTIVNNLADAVLSTDKDGVIRVYNASSLNLLDTNNSLNGHHIDEIMTLYDQDDKHIELFNEFKKARSVVVRDDLTISIGGETLRLEVTFSPIRSSYSRTKQSETEDGYIVIMRDVTKSKSLEEERDEFISVVSHELRTPITIAEGTISNVQVMMQRPDISQSILKEGITTAHDQVIFLSKMVNDLSTLSRAERGVADEPEPIDVRALVNDLYAEYEPQARKKKLHFDLDASSHLGQVTASRLYLKELLQNFITNAIKYTKEGKVTLVVDRKDNKVLFEVKDSGIGISKSDQAKIFNKFYRSEDYRTRETGGTGLGLYVATKLARKLGTHIELSSRLNHGSSFSFELPVSEDKK